MDPAISGHVGKAAPSASARLKLVMPATSPLIPAMNTASDADTLRVRLLSSAQHKQAVATARLQRMLPTAAPLCGHASNRPPAKINIIPITIQRSEFLSNTTQDQNEVRTSFRFSSRYACDADVWPSPTFRSTGTTTPQPTKDPKNP